ncbi:hypothetical protein BBM54_03765 [Vibrio parahaemolyticus]|nr:hypothetical protein BBM46_08060 [Vibrio parahaemolyticus]OEA17882.1 hypothetical protein BBM54_03765 [Vibrio parahaemolyticus]
MKHNSIFYLNTFHISIEKNTENNHLSYCFYCLKIKQKIQNEDMVGITSHTKPTSYLVIRKNRSNDDKRNVSQILGWHTMGHKRASGDRADMSLDKNALRKIEY